MNDENLQYAISQYVDGTLPPAEVAALEKRLREDPEARRLLDEYRRIGDLVQVALPEPEMDWDRLSSQISAAIDRDGITIAEPEAPATYRLGFWKPLALAAGLLLCATAVVLVIRSGHEPQNTPPRVAINDPQPAPATPDTPAPAPQPAIASAQPEIQVLTPPKPTGEPMLAVTIGPPSGPLPSILDLHPELDSHSSISIAAEPANIAMSDDFGVIQ